ncbi:MAG TPA: chemotaxis protein CheW [Thermoleophilaceae bacterium]|jgi:purine-binding chemotaxis protein CheW
MAGTQQLPPDARGSEADIDRILRERAAALARSSDDAESDDETLRVIVLATGGERYGIEVQDVLEVEPLTDITPIPGTPAFWAGVVNLRGSMYPVLDLERYLGLPPSHDGREPKIVLVSTVGLTVGLLADEVPGISNIRVAELAPPVAAERGGARVVRGVTPGMLSVLDLDALLADPALVVEHDAS